MAPLGSHEPQIRHDRNKYWNFRAEFHYESADGTDTGIDTATDKQKCTVKT